jgi:hypothetical protein
MIHITMDTAVLDEALRRLQVGESVSPTIDALFHDLYSVYQTATPEAWRTFAVETCRKHPLMALVHQDPFTSRAYRKPRGYAGDAVMLDFIYGPEDGLRLPDLDEATGLGRQICAYTANGTAARAVRARRRMLIEKLNAVAANKSQPHVLSVACGHLREAKRCAAFLEGRIGRYVALDQDQASLAQVERELGLSGVETVHASVRDLLIGRTNLSHFDLIYVSGLYDYLSQRVAQQLSAALFDLLNTGGHLVITNCLPDLDNMAYMEAFMDWWLIYRTREQLTALAETLPPQLVETVRLYTEENQVIAFLDVTRGDGVAENKRQQIVGDRGRQDGKRHEFDLTKRSARLWPPR